VKCRAVNLDKNGQSGQNNKLAFAVEEAFRQNPLFDSSPASTKLAGKVEDVETATDTFTFSLKLTLKKQMQTM